MGVFGFLRLFSFWVSLFFFTFCFRGLIAEEDVRKTPPSNTVEDFSPDIATANFPPPPPPPPPPPSPVFRGKSNIAPFKPSIAVIVGVLTTMFSVTFLLLLYAKHCKRNNGGGANAGNPSSGAPASSTARRNSGIDRSVIESLPIFRFGSLRGQKDGLECAVCLTRFESTEVLRLLPKCKHAFHVECVDTWLDAHSTCPLCRYRVDPEDVLLVDDMKLGEDNGEQRHEAAEAVEDKAEQHQSVVSIEDLQSRGSEAGSETRTPNQSLPNPLAETACGFRRISGRHSSAEEKTSRYLQILVHQPSDSDSSSRRSLDSVNLKRKNESVSVGCFDRGGRKDGLLLPEAVAAETETQERRLEHRIIISASEPGEFQHRWSDLHPSDLLFLRSEMIITNSGRYSLPPIPSNHHHHHRHNPRNQEQQKRQESRGEGGEGVEEDIDVNGRSVINARSVSEITGLSRFPNRTSGHYHRHHQHHQPEREARFVDRWLAWASHLRSTAHHTNQ